MYHVDPLDAYPKVDDFLKIEINEYMIFYRVKYFSATLLLVTLWFLGLGPGLEKWVLGSYFTRLRGLTRYTWQRV